MDGILPWIETLSDFLGDCLLLAIEAGVATTLLAVVVLTINLLFRRWISAGQMALLWGLVLIRLLMPMGPASPLSLQNLFVSDGSTIEARDAVQPAEVAMVDLSTNGAANAYQMQSLDGGDAANSESSTNWIEIVISSLPILWVVVGVGGLARTTFGYWRFCRRVKQTPQCSDCRLIRLWEQCCDIATVKRTPSIVQFDGVEQPAIMGLLHRMLLLPNDAADLSDEQLKMVMLHELAHVRRWDIATNWALLVIRAIHWWNPIYWLAASRFRSLREQACDAFVIRQTANNSIRDYSELLLKLAARGPSASRWRVMVPASILGFFPAAFRNRAVRGRLKALRTSGFKPGRWHTAGVYCVVLTLTSVGLTDARTPVIESKPMDMQNFLATRVDLQKSFEPREVYNGPLVTRTYDVANVLERIAAKTPAIDAVRDRKTMDWLLRLMFRTELGLPRDSADISTAEGMPAARRLTYTIDDKTLSVQAPVALHDKLGSLLDAWAESGLGQFTVETRFVGSNRDLAGELGINWQYVEAFSSDQAKDLPTRTEDGMPVVRAESRVDDFLPVVVATLDKNQVKTLVDSAQRDRQSSVLQTPKVTIFNGQDAMIVDCSQRPFVVGVTSVVGELATAHAPKIVVIDEGIKIRLLGTQSRDLKKVHLRANFNLSSIGEVTEAPIKMHGEQVTIQVPHVNRRVLDIASDIEDGQTLLVGCLPTEGQGSYMYFLLTTTNITEPDQL